MLGAPDPILGEIVCAVIQPVDVAQPPDVQDLHAFCRAHLAHYKTPRVWYVVDAFPFTETGKLQKFKFAEAIRAGTMTPYART